MSEQAEQVVLEYLRRVGDAAHGALRPDQRLHFMLRLRARIEAMRESQRASESEQVARVIARFGDPAALVARERERLAQELQEQNGGQTTPDAASSARTSAEEQDAAFVTQPISVTRPPESGAADDSQGSPAESSADPAETFQMQSPAPSVQPVSAGHSGTSTPQARARYSGPPLYQPRSARESGRDVPSAFSRMVEQLPPEIRNALRGGAVEAVGLALAGVGGLLLPFPLWFIGALIIVIAVGWSVQDKLVGLVPAPLLAAVGAGVLAVFEYGGFSGYLRALGEQGWTLFRLGAILGAVYLTARLMARIRGDRGSRTPWRRINPNAR